ncbi:MAG: TVP38/TMEM64 family protein [Lawsonibacter sp.]|jgi:uncharacterized membrane protein YdjX (TVP38/TMEM64 family)
MRIHRSILCVTLLLLLILGSIFLYQNGFFSIYTSQASLQAYIEQSAPYSHLVFFLVQLLSVILAPIPSNLTAAVGGMLFGTWPAFFLTFAAVFSGSLFVFLLARILGKRFADRFVSQHISKKYQNMIQSKTTLFLFLAFLFPYFPDDVLCILAGLTPISFFRFALITFLARPWGLLFACAFGGSAIHIPLWALVTLGLLGIALFALGLTYGTRLEQTFLSFLERRYHS